MTDRIGKGQLYFNCSPNLKLIVLFLSYIFINELQPSVRQHRTQALYHTGFVGWHLLEGQFGVAGGAGKTVDTPGLIQG